MGTKFQNRLVGIIVIILIVIIVLPILFDSKKYNKTNFVKIFLVPKDKYEVEHNMLTSNTSRVEKSLTHNKSKIISEIVFDSKDKLINNDDFYQELKLKSVTKTKNARLLVDEKNNIKKKLQYGKEPYYIIQLGALKNAAKVEEIIAKLRLYGYLVYTDPVLPIKDQLTKIFIGLNVSKEKLQSSLLELKILTGLQGQIYNYNPYS